MSGERLSALLAQKSVRQSELARRVGVSQTAINKLTLGLSYGSKHLHRIARELGTTPAYLTGETDDPDENAPPAPALDGDERVLLDCFQELAPADRAALLRIALSLSGKAAPGTVHAPDEPSE